MSELYEDWSTPAFKQILLLHCLLSGTDTSQIESRHASVRRNVIGKSVQVKKMSFEGLGAHWIFQQLRRWKSDRRPRPLSFRRSKDVWVAM